MPVRYHPPAPADLLPVPGVTLGAAAAKIKNWQRDDLLLDVEAQPGRPGEGLEVNVGSEGEGFTASERRHGLRSTIGECSADIETQRQRAPGKQTHREVERRRAA